MRPIKEKSRLDEFSMNLPENLPKTVIIGASGFLGSHFLKAYRHVYPDCIGTALSPKGTNIFHLDLLNPNITSLHLSETNHKKALIFAAIPKISKCETEKELTWKVNVEGTLELIRELVAEGIKPIFFSSDYVFDGNTGNYSDNAPTNPITEYGRQKAEVEAKIGEISKGNYLVVRLSKVFSIEKGDNSLLDEMACILASGSILRAAFDQIFCPTLISDLVNAVIKLQVCKTTGIVNVCSPEAWSRYDLALEIAKAMEVNLDMICPNSLDEICPEPKRPKNTSMKIERLLQEIKYTFTPMSKCIEAVAKNWRK